jgi:trigger factor
MKTEFVDVSDTQKTLTIEIPSDAVDAEIDRIAKGYARQARLPGFRPGKAPASVIKQRFRDQIHHDVVHDLVPKAVEEALSSRGIEPVDTPSISNVAIHEGQPLTFTAAVETVPGFDPGDLATIALTRTLTTITDGTVEQTLQRLRERAGKLEPVEMRPVADGDTLVADLERTDADGKSEPHNDVTIQVGSPANPPGFDANLVGLNAGDSKTFEVHFPADYTVKELAGTTVSYAVKAKEIRHRVLPELDDEFARDIGQFESLTALRDRVRADLQEEAADTTTRQLRTDLLSQLAKRLSFDPPASLVDREMDRRVEEFARQLMQQNMDPRQAGIDWDQFREAQRDAAIASVASALVLDEIARREHLTVAAEEVDKEIERFAERAGRTPAALRAQLEKEGGVSRLSVGLRREKAVDLVMSRATINETRRDAETAREES